MLYKYVTASGDKAILDRALPLAEVEMKWWATNRTIEVTSPYTNKTHKVSHYAVVNTAPRPEVSLAFAVCLNQLNNCLSSLTEKTTLSQMVPTLQHLTPMTRKRHYTPS